MISSYRFGVTIGSQRLLDHPVQRKSSAQAPGKKAHLAHLLLAVSSCEAAGTLPFLEGVYQMESGLSRRIRLQTLTRDLLSHSFLRVDTT
jgi:hypothetical protein